jgi:hypothetical protein
LPVLGAIGTAKTARHQMVQTERFE